MVRFSIYWNILSTLCVFHCLCMIFYRVCFFFKLGGFLFQQTGSKLKVGKSEILYLLLGKEVRIKITTWEAEKSRNYIGCWCNSGSSSSSWSSFAEMGLFTHVQWQFCHCCEFAVNGSTIGCKLLSSWLFPPWLSNLCFLWPDKNLIDLHHGMSHPSPGMHHASAHSHPRTFCMVLVVIPCHAIPLRAVHVAHSSYSCSCDIFVDVVENFGIHPVKVRKWVLSRLSLIQLLFQCNWFFVSECSWAR